MLLSILHAEVSVENMYISSEKMQHGCTATTRPTLAFDIIHELNDWFILWKVPLMTNNVLMKVLTAVNVCCKKLLDSANANICYIWLKIIKV